LLGRRIDVETRMLVLVEGDSGPCGGARNFGPKQCRDVLRRLQARDRIAVTPVLCRVVGASQRPENDKAPAA
jgi:hypothetical protein